MFQYSYIHSILQYFNIYMLSFHSSKDLGIIPTLWHKEGSDKGLLGTLFFLLGMHPAMELLDHTWRDYF